MWSTAEMVSLMKRNNCYKATEHTRTLMEIFGGNAASDECVVFNAKVY